MAGGRRWLHNAQARGPAFVERHAEADRPDARTLVEEVQYVSWQLFMRGLCTSVKWTKEALKGRPYCAVAMGGDYRGVLNSGLQCKSAHWLYSAVVAARMLPRASLQLTQVRRESDGPHGDFWIDEHCNRLSEPEVVTKITGLIVVVLDDISISGSQLTDLVNQLPLPIPFPLILMCVPFMTAHARVAISADVPLPLTWAPSELIPEMSATSRAALHRLYPFLPDRQVQIGGGAAQTLTVFQHKTPNAASFPFPLEYGLIGGSTFEPFADDQNWDLRTHNAYRVVPRDTPPYKVTAPDWKELRRHPQRAYALGMHPFYDDITDGGTVPP